MDDTLTMPDGRTVGFADGGDPSGTAVMWCHGGPGSRLEPMWLLPAATTAGLRIVGIDRPGYGRSTPWPGRTIAGWVPDLLAVADRLGIERFVTVGVSTGGAYAIATAVAAPDRVLGVVACCAMTDMRDPAARASMHPPHTHALWDAPDRDAAFAAAVDVHGEHGEKMINGGMNDGLCPADRATFADPAWMRDAMIGFPDMFSFGNVGYTDDRIADGPGWVTFDATAVRCPVVVLHGGSDLICNVVNARHTASIVPGAQLVVLDGEGHFSVEAHVVPTIVRMLAEHGRAAGGS